MLLLTGRDRLGRLGAAAPPAGREGRQVREADVRSVAFAPSLVYAPGDRWLTLLERLALLPLSSRGRGRAAF